MANETLSLTSKIAAIGNEIGVTAKTGKNSQQYYDYIEYAVVSGKLRSLFDKYKISIIPQVVDYDVSEVQSKDGKFGYHYTLRMSFLIKDGESDEQIERKWLGEAIDYGDKSVNKAATAGTKYFYMRLFNVSEKGEEETDKTTPDIVKPEAPAQESNNFQVHQGGKLSFADIRENIKDMNREELEVFKIKVFSANMTERQKAAIEAIFKQRENVIKAQGMGF